MTDTNTPGENELPYDAEEAKGWWLPERDEIKWLLSGDELKGMHAAYIVEHYMTKLELRAQELELMLRALVAGWTVDKVSLYDEEGVDGWRWTDPRGTEYCCTGDWNELPEFPDAARSALGGEK
jgi:hypothetical protein